MTESMGGEVLKWLVLDGIGHLLAAQKSGWHQTICGTLTSNGMPSDSQPLRICRKCRAKLKEYKPRDDFAKSIDACYEAVRERVRNGGKTWEPK